MLPDRKGTFSVMQVIETGSSAVPIGHLTIPIQVPASSGIVPGGHPLSILAIYISTPQSDIPTRYKSRYQISPPREAPFLNTSGRQK